MPMQPIIGHLPAALIVAYKRFIQCNLKAKRLARMLSLQRTKLREIDRKANPAAIGLFDSTNSRCCRTQA